MVLTDDALFERILGTEQAVAFLHLHLAQGDAGLLGHDGVEVGGLQHSARFLAQAVEPVEHGGDAVGTLADGGDAGKLGIVVLYLGGEDAVGLVGDAIVKPLEVFERHGIVGGGSGSKDARQVLAIGGDVGAAHVVHGLEQREGAVDEVDGGGGQGFLGEIALGQPHGGLQHLRTDREAVVSLILGHDTAEYAEALVGGGLVEGDALHLSGKLLVGLYMLGVAVGGGGADEQEIALGGLLLEYRRGTVEAALTVEQFFYRLDDEDAAFLGREFGNDLLEAVVDLALVRRAGREGGGVEFVGAGLTEEGGHGSVGQIAEESFDERGLSYARLSGDEDIGLGLAAENLVEGGDLFLEADDGATLAAPYLGEAVDAVFAKGRRTGGGGLYIGMDGGRGCLLAA